MKHKQKNLVSPSKNTNKKVNDKKNNDKAFYVNGNSISAMEYNLSHVHPRLLFSLISLKFCFILHSLIELRP